MNKEYKEEKGKRPGTIKGKATKFARYIISD